MMRNRTRAVLMGIDSMEVVDKFLRGRPFRAQCMAGCCGRGEVDNKKDQCLACVAGLVVLQGA